MCFFFIWNRNLFSTNWGFINVVAVTAPVPQKHVVWTLTVQVFKMAVTHLIYFHAYFFRNKHTPHIPPLVPTVYGTFYPDKKEEAEAIKWQYQFLWL